MIRFVFGKVLDQLIPVILFEINPIMDLSADSPGLGNSLIATLLHFSFVRKKIYLTVKIFNIYIVSTGLTCM